MARTETAPGVGDLVRNSAGQRRVVTDIRRGQLILRPVRGGSEETPVPFNDVTLLVAGWVGSR